MVILCGGFGRRLRPVVNDRPKILAKIGNKPFLDILVDNLLRYGFKHIILNVGYLKEQVIDHFRDKSGCDIEFSEEKTPLGTGGALKRAESFVKSDMLLVMNGDSFCDLDFNKLLDFHIGKKALMTMVLATSDVTGDYGSIVLNDSCRIQKFEEKSSGAAGKVISAGIYLMQKDVFRYMPERDVFSLEYDLFPKLIKYKCYGYLTESELFDIGTPERYERAGRIIGKRMELAGQDE